MYMSMARNFQSAYHRRSVKNWVTNEFQEEKNCVTQSRQKFKWQKTQF